MEKIHLIKGDITTVICDSLVNPANTSLLGGSGVDGVIHKVAGKSLLDECQRIRNKQGGCKIGEAVITSGGNLLVKYVIHTVGPTWTGGDKNEKELLMNSYKSCLDIAVKYSIKTIAFPNISTGRFRFPKEIAASIAIQTVKNFLIDNKTIETVIFVCFDEENYDLYREILHEFDK